MHNTLVKMDAFKIYQMGKVAENEGDLKKASDLYDKAYHTTPAKEDGIIYKKAQDRMQSVLIEKAEQKNRLGNASHSFLPFTTG